MKVCTLDGLRRQSAAATALSLQCPRSTRKEVKPYCFMATPRETSQELLRELFQFDSADLDFGIYRIMRHKRALIEQGPASLRWTPPPSRSAGPAAFVRPRSLGPRPDHLRPEIADLSTTASLGFSGRISSSKSWSFSSPLNCRWRSRSASSAALRLSNLWTTSSICHHAAHSTPTSSGLDDRPVA